MVTVSEVVPELEEKVKEVCCVLIQTMPEMFTDFYKWQWKEDDCRFYLLCGSFKKKKILVPNKVRDLVLKYLHSSISATYMGKKKTRVLTLRE
ncbi:hypothetical protein PR048_027035 [Dryococelus australis]|uniref:Uncharacterized protein n=1 Tax=Dryococelus australis TaxID=614101 RepID=A0ABQ9GGI7_9NEOP|nr:hypothetical protein PR048_027035 [Dryococelus australis]